MRIVCLITVGAFLLSIETAESDWPFGVSGQCHQKLPRPIILEPVLKHKSESSPLDWFRNMVSNVIKPQKKPPPAIIGPIDLPRMAGQIYIRQLENNSPWESNHVIIKMVTRDPLIENNVQLDSNHRSEDYSRKVSKLNGYQTFLTDNHYAKRQYNYQPQNHRQMLNPFSKPFHSFTSNDYRHEDDVQNRQEHYDSHSFPSRNYRKENHRSNYQRSQPMSANSYHESRIMTISSSPSIHRPIAHHVPNRAIYNNAENNQQHRAVPLNLRSNDFHSTEPDFLHTTKTSRLDYSSLTDNENPDKTISNVTRMNDNAFSNSPAWPSGKYRKVVRNDRMVRDYQNSRQILSKNRIASRGPSNFQESRAFHHGPMLKFELDDVGGLEVVNAPNLKLGSYRDIASNDKNEDYEEKSRVPVAKVNEDSISIGDGKNLTKVEFVEYTNPPQTESQTQRILPLKLSSYRVIDRSHRSEGRRNITLESSSEIFKRGHRINETKNRSVDDRNNSTDANIKDDARTIKATTEVSQEMVNTTARNRWQFQEGRVPTRIVKAIYRRKPVKENERYSKQIRNSDSSSEASENSPEAHSEN